MKKLLFLPAMLLGLTAFGQTREAKVKYGVTANLHQSNIKGIHWDSKGRLAPAVGAYAHIILDEEQDTNLYLHGRWVLQPQLEFSWDGENNDPSTGKQKYRANFISVPVYVKYYFAFDELAEKNFFVQLGPQFGFVVGDKAEGPSDALSTENFERRDYVKHQNDDNLKKFNFGASVGAGYAFTPEWAVFARYDHGFAKAYKNYDLFRTWHYKLGVGVNYTFPQQ